MNHQPPSRPAPTGRVCLSAGIYCDHLPSWLIGESLEVFMQLSALPMMLPLTYPPPNALIPRLLPVDIHWRSCIHVTALDDLCRSPLAPCNTRNGYALGAAGSGSHVGTTPPHAGAILGGIRFRRPEVYYILEELTDSSDF